MILIATLMLALLLYAQSKTTAQTTASKQAVQPTSGNAQARSVKKIQVTAQTLASLQAGKPYIIDLSRNGTVYYVASGVDYNRIQVRTSTGKLESLTDLLKKAGPSVTKLDVGDSLLGLADDVKTILETTFENYHSEKCRSLAWCTLGGGSMKCYCSRP